MNRDWICACARLLISYDQMCCKREVMYSIQFCNDFMTTMVATLYVSLLTGKLPCSYVRYPLIISYHLFCTFRFRLGSRLICSIVRLRRICGGMLYCLKSLPFRRLSFDVFLFSLPAFGSSPFSLHSCLSSCISNSLFSLSFVCDVSIFSVSRLDIASVLIPFLSLYSSYRFHKYG